MKIHATASMRCSRVAVVIIFVLLYFFGISVVKCQIGSSSRQYAFADAVPMSYEFRADVPSGLNLNASSPRSMLAVLNKKQVASASLSPRFMRNHQVNLPIPPLTGIDANSLRINFAFDSTFLTANIALFSATVSPVGISFAFKCSSDGRIIDMRWTINAADRNTAADNSQLHVLLSYSWQTSDVDPVSGLRWTLSLYMLLGFLSAGYAIWTGYHLSPRARNDAVYQTISAVPKESEKKEQNKK